MKRAPEVSDIRPAGRDHQVVSVTGGSHGYRRRPCGPKVPTEDRPGCPWRVDGTGFFPPEAFAHSADTATDISSRMFGCHESGTRDPKTCAGFLLRGADHNMAVRMKIATGRIDPGQITDGGHKLHSAGMCPWPSPTVCTPATRRYGTASRATPKTLRKAIMPCCDLHDQNCEPPSELCCAGCTEAAHPAHIDGSVCSNPDLSRCNRHVAAELLAWAAMLDAGGGIHVLKTVYQDLAVDLRSRAFWLSPPNPDDHTEIQARLAELRGGQ